MKALADVEVFVDMLSQCDRLMDTQTNCHNMWIKRTPSKKTAIFRNDLIFYYKFSILSKTAVCINL